MEFAEGTVENGTEQLAGLIRAALESADLAAFSDLLHPDVRWGAPGDPTPPCQNRDQVLAWYRQGHDSGVRSQVTEVTATGDHLLVGLVVWDTGEAHPGGDQANRWQVLTVREGRIAAIVGFETRSEAAAWAGLPAGQKSQA